MKTTIVLIISVLICSINYSQVLNQDAKGSSSILFNGATIGLDIQDAAVNFTLNNFRNQYIADSAKKTMYGFNFKVKNNDGVAGLFTQGSFNPESKIIGIIGHSWYTDDKSFFQSMKDSLNLKTIKLDTLTIRFIREIITTINEINVSQNSDETELEGLKKELINLMDTVEPKYYSKKMLTLANKYKNYNKDIETISLITKTKYSEYKRLKQDLENEIKTAESEFKCLRNYSYKRWTIYGTGGINSSFFKLQNTIDTTDFSKSFKDQKFYGYDIKLGINCQFGGEWILGATFGIQQTNTFDNLSKKEYTLETISANSNQQLISETKVTAFSGDYKTFSQTKIEADATRFIKAGKTDIIALDLYIRQFFPLKKDISNAMTNLGLSSYFFKNNGKFIGGIYIEFSDLFNNKKSEEGTTELKPFERRISTGLVAKISLNSLFAY